MDFSFGSLLCELLKRKMSLSINYNLWSPENNKNRKLLRFSLSELFISLVESRFQRNHNNCKCVQNYYKCRHGLEGCRPNVVFQEIGADQKD